MKKNLTYKSCSCAKTDLTWKAGEWRHGMLSEFLPGQGYLNFFSVYTYHTTFGGKTDWRNLVLLPNSPGPWVLASSIYYSTICRPLRSATTTAWEGILVCTELHPMIWIKITLPKNDCV